MGIKNIVSTAFTVADKMSGPIGKITGNLTGNFKKAFSSIASQVAIGNLAAKGISSVVGGLRTATTQFIDFDAAVVKSGALFKDLDSTSNTFKDSLAAIGNEARRVAAATEFNAVDTAGALQKMAMAGMSSKTSMELLRGTTDLATAAGIDLTTAVDIATDALGAFGMAATKGNLQRISDVMAKTASSFNTDLTMMFESIKYAGPSFTAAGQSIDTLAASIGVLANAGIKGSDAGTALNAVFTQLKNGAKKTAIEKLIGPVTDAKGNFIDLFEIVGKLQGRLAGMGNAQRGEILSGIFGVRGEKAINLLLQTGVEDLQKFKAEMAGSAGAASQMADVMRGSIKNQIEILKSSLTELGFKFIEAFQDRGSEALQKLIETVQKIDPSEIINFASDALSAVMDLIKGVKDFIPVILMAYKAGSQSLKGLLIPVRWLAKHIETIGPAVLGAYAAFTVFRKAQAAIDAVKNALVVYKVAQEAAAVATAATTASVWAGTTAATAGGISAGAAGISAGTATTAFTGLSAAIAGSQLAMAGLVGLAIGGIIAVWAVAKKTQEKAAAKEGVTSDQWGTAHQNALDRVERWRMEFDAANMRGDTDWINNNPEIKYKAAMEQELNRFRSTSIADFKNLEDPQPEMSEYEKAMLEAQRMIAKNTAKTAEGVEGLGEASAQGVPGRLSYSQMGKEDIWAIARAGA